MYNRGSFESRRSRGLELEQVAQSDQVDQCAKVPASVLERSASTRAGAYRPEPATAGLRPEGCWRLSLYSCHSTMSALATKMDE